MKRASGVAALALGLSFASSVRAAELDYQAAEGCPSRESFVSEVESRAKLSSSKKRTFVVRFVRRTDHVEGSFTVTDAGGAGEPRVIDAPTCDEAMRAIALSVALAAEAEPSDPPTQSVVVIATTPPVIDTGGGSAPTLPVRNGPGTFAWSVGLDLDALGFAATGAVAAGSIEVGISPIPNLDLRFAFRRSLEPTIDVGPTHSSLVWTTGRLAPCIGDFRFGRLGIGPCGFVELGQLLATGSATKGTVWGAIGAFARADVAIAGPFELRATAGAFLPLDRTTISYDPAFPVYRAPVVGLLGSLGIAAKFR